MDGAVDLRWLGHATVLLELPGLRLLTDPHLRAGLGPLRRHGPVPSAPDLGPIDVVAISHSHPDHLDRRSLQALAGDPLVIVPVGLGSTIGRMGGRAWEVRVGATVEIGPGWTIRAVPARHWRWPRSPRTQAVGYLIESPGRDGIYFAGDTAPYRAMRDFAERVDIALLPVGTWGPHLGPGHLSPRTAAEVARDLGARVAVPIHWGTFFPPGLERLVGARLTEPANRFAGWAADIAPGLDVRILQPGDATRIVRPTQPDGGPAGG
ncbi:MAG: MBL fold metallo-hydrolase, partial [Candidatus Limnocylindrales bacterium]